MGSEITAMNPLTRLSLREQAYDSIREGIIHGDLPPGSKIVERVIADRLGVSRAPVKEALLRLEREGLVVSMPDARYVKQLNLRELAEIYEVREILEGKAAELAACHTSHDNVRQLEHAGDALRSAYDRRDVRAFANADAGIHQLIWTQAENSYLQRTLDSIATPTFILITDYTRHSDHNWEFTLQEHEDLVASICRGDARAACRTMAEHVRRSYERGVKVLSAEQS